MKLLHVIGEFNKKAGGTYTAVTSIVDLLNKLGHRNLIVATHNENEETDRALREDIVSFKRSFPKRFRKSKDGQSWLEANIEEYDFVLVHEIWGGLGLDACRLALKRKVKYCIWPHGSLDPFDLEKKRILKIFLGKLWVNNILRKADHIFCTSTKEKELLDYFGRKSDNARVLALPVDFCLETTVLQPPRPSLISESLSDNCFAFLFFSRINYKKGLDIFLRAFAQCIKGKLIRNDARLVIAGTGTPEYEKYIDDIIGQEDITEYVIKVGFISGEQKYIVYKNAHVFILPSKNENFGISVIESLQVGTPVLISDNIYICQELFNMHPPGWVCKYDVESVRDEIVKATTMLSKETREAALKTGRQFFSSTVIDSYNIYFPKANMQDKKA
jgi:glycosyltransferase involved in cell wall biosynthesis